jgi:iron complex outermembrane receptor protein
LWLSSSDTTGDVDRAIPNLFPIESSAFELQSHVVALFGEVNAAPWKRWQVGLAARIESTTRSFERRQRIPDVALYDALTRFHNFAPQLSIRRDLSANAALTAILAMSGRPGGWSAYTADSTLARFHAERSRSLEMALITEDPSHSLRITYRAYIYDIRNYQIERSFTAADYLVVNAPRARSLGAEWESEWEPTSGLTLRMGVSGTHATLREFVNPFDGTDLAGNRVPNAPSYTANLSIRYRSTRGWFASAEGQRTGTTYFEESENRAFAQRAYEILSASLGYNIGRLRLTLYGSNLLNERYYATIVPGVVHGVPGAPRTIGCELSAVLN